MPKKPTYDELKKRVKELELEATNGKLAQKALELKITELDSFINNIPDMAWIKDANSRFIVVNSAFGEIVRMNPKSLIHETCEVCFGKQEVKKFQEDDQKVLQNKRQSIIEEQIVDSQNHKIWLETIKSPILDKSGKAVGTVGIARDITKRKQAEEALRKAHQELERKVEERTVELVKRYEQLKQETQEHEQAQIALRESKERYALATRAGKVGVWDWNMQTQKFYLDPNVKAILGYSDEEIPNDLDVWATYVHPDDHQGVMEAFQAHIDGKTPEYVYEHRMLHKDGSIRWVLVRGTAIRDTQGNPVRVVGTDADITLRKNAEEAMRESEEKYRLLVENANDAIFVMQDQKVKFPNPRAVEIGRYLGVNLEQVPFINHIHPQDREMVIKRHISRLKGEKVPSTYSFRLIARDGEELWMELNAILINWEGKPATLNFLRDITKQKKLEAQLQQARRMEALGTLAGGIAHDFNNLLMGIQGRTSLMLMDTDLPQLHYEELKGIEDIVKSAAGLTKQLLGFARTGKYEVKPADMNELIHKSSQMFGRTKKETKIHTKYQESIWPVEVDRSQIEQVLLNLYVNAWQAMPGGGELYLQTENVMFDESYSKPYKLSPGKYVKISVTDTGVGMDEATQEKIFEPFFTTKKMSRGMGLGLASTYGIIKNHDGIINVFSQKGEGTTFDIYLPASEKEVIEEKQLPEAVLKGTETVLFVDDEDMIVGIGEKTLKRMGYDVITAKNGKEAIELYKENKARVDIVVLDMIMPEMGGGETYDRLKEINPNVRVLLSSGYSIEGQASEILKRGCDGFIQKPFRMRLLSRKIREVLDKE